MMPSAPWNGTVRTLRNAASERHISGMLHEIGQVFVGGKAEPRRRAVDHRVHRVRERPAPGRNGDDHQNLDGFLGKGDPEYRMQDLRDPGVLGGCEDRGERRPRHAQQRNAGGAQEKRGPDLGGGPGRSSAAITSHNISSAGATAAVPMTVGRDARRFIRMANMPFFSVNHSSKHAGRERKAAGGLSAGPGFRCER